MQTVPENMRKEECEKTQQIFREENGTYAKTRNFKKKGIFNWLARIHG